jgi:prevent-host-death family protein
LHHAAAESGAVRTTSLVLLWQVKEKVEIRGDTAGRSKGARVTRRPPLTTPYMSYKMSYMGKGSVSLRELQQNLKRVVARVERGEVVEVTRRNRPVARLAPVRLRRPASEWPDLEARTRAVFGDRVVTPGGSEVVVKERGDW